MQTGSATWKPETGAEAKGNAVANQHAIPGGRKSHAITCLFRRVAGLPKLREITFKDFMHVAKRRGHIPESLAALFRGKIEEPREFFERVMSCKWKGEDRSGVVIPYRSAIEFYEQENHFFLDLKADHRACACGCGLAVFDRKKWATPGCRQSKARQKVTDTSFAVS
jgi:hypothetical protein